MNWSATGSQVSSPMVTITTVFPATSKTVSRLGARSAFWVMEIGLATKSQTSGHSAVAGYRSHD